MHTERPLRIALVGDYNPSVTAHQAIPTALADASRALAVDVQPRWLPTEAIRSRQSLAGFDGIWCVPASPYRNMDGALLAIRHAREAGIPFLGTCGGFQHAVIEYARHVLGWADADHAETMPDATRAVISPLSCSLVEESEVVQLLPGSGIALAYGAEYAKETYHCRYGINPLFRERLSRGPLRVTATDASGAVRAMELDGHVFFMTTLFQPERAALVGKISPVVAAFVRAVATHIQLEREATA
ncbi:CTP synthase [Chitinimonas naiadis]